MRWNRNPDSPWNPVEPLQITPSEFEKQVVAWLEATSPNSVNFKVDHLRHLKGSGGDYEIDAVAECTIYEEAQILIIVECKRYSKPVEREKLLALNAKKMDVKAHKAMMFATCGFQSGALEYARNNGIATIVFTDGKFTYETKARGANQDPPSWVNLPEYIGIFVEEENGAIHSSVFEENRIEKLSNWIKS